MEKRRFESFKVISCLKKVNPRILSTELGQLGVLPKFHSKAFLKIHEYPSADDFEGKKRLHGV